ncbi:MAG: hypothetical protein AAB920_02935 [Patescibacteria group bacterium]
MSRKFIIIFVLALLLLAAGYWYWQSQEGGASTPEQNALKSAEEGLNAITDNVSQGVLPSLDVNTNPLSQTPDVNPISKTNPFSGLKTNPFGK